MADSLELRDLAVVEASVLEHLAELHPDRLTADELLL